MKTMIIDGKEYMEVGVGAREMLTNIHGDYVGWRMKYSDEDRRFMKKFGLEADYEIHP